MTQDGNKSPGWRIPLRVLHSFLLPAKSFLRIGEVCRRETENCADRSVPSPLPWLCNRGHGDGAGWWCWSYEPHCLHQHLVMVFHGRVALAAVCCKYSVLVGGLCQVKVTHKSAWPKALSQQQISCWFCSQEAVRRCSAVLTRSPH